MLAESAPLPTFREVAAARTRIAELDIEIEDLKRSIQARLTERDKCCDVLAAVAQYKHPILSLPAEITSEIFVRFLPSDLEFIPPIGPKSPSFLLRICRQWRGAALATPQLWSSIDLQLHGDRKSARNHQFKLFESWLKRSGNFPLSIRLWDMRRGSTSIATSPKFKDAILHHASRLQHVDIYLPYDDLRSFTAPMPLLCTASVDPSDHPKPATTPSATATALFPLAPMLKQVALDLGYNPFATTLPWSQLTTLTASVNISEAIYILRQSTALETCALTIYPLVTVPDHRRVPPLPIRTLSLLWASGNADESAVQLVNARTLPVLSTLVVSEFLLGSNPIAAISRLRPQGYPRTVTILHAGVSLDVYKEAFPDVELIVHPE
ncbi:hypothetical protein FB45DRAFT_730491 [Roridomyces roridus]|uniref:F-box domain-containing protein n=1 Tax=Roridomyces roridus TaxID=1738132 RepID=A0AAD7CID0_9AGAR|nr:hypothetical protein FB45DRAFT_730491 [Roridomyces roridus]